MQPWQAIVIGVAVAVTVTLFILGIDTVEYQEIGLNYSWISETVEERPYHGGRYYLGLGNHFIKFPKTVQSVFFVDSWAGESARVQGPPLMSRTADGLNIRLEVSLQYKLDFDRVYQLFSHIGPRYEPTFVRMAIEQLSAHTTKHNASDFFRLRTNISEEMARHLNAHFEEHAFATVPFFQLRTVHLPREFESAIQETQIKIQDIQIAKFEQASLNVSFEQLVMQAGKYIETLETQAVGRAQAILADNNASCLQYNVTQSLQAQALKGMKSSTGWSASEMLRYLKIRTVRNHPSERTVIRL